MPEAPSSKTYGRARQSSGTGPCGDCRTVLWVPGPRGLYSGKGRFIENPGVRGGRHLAKRSSEKFPVAYPYVKVQVRELRELLRVVGIVAPFAQRGPLPGTNSLYRAPGGIFGTGDLC